MSLKSESLEAIENEITEKANYAQSYMKAIVNKRCDKGFATGKLEGSIVNERVSKWHWQVGSHLEYASYVDEGRKELEYPRDRQNGRLYLKGLDFWMPRGAPVGPMAAKHFIQATKDELEG